MGEHRRIRAAGALALSLLVVCAVAGPAHAKAKDTDRDGMPDKWEKAHSLNWRKPDAKADADKDGISNIREFHAGLDPQTVNGKCTELQLALGAKPGECAQGGVSLYLN